MTAEHEHSARKRSPFTEAQSAVLAKVIRHLKDETDEAVGEALGEIRAELLDDIARLRDRVVTLERKAAPDGVNLDAIPEDLVSPW